MNKKETDNISIGIIGGTGIYDPDIFTIKEERKVYTPFGEPSDKVTICSLNKINISFISRHGKGHRIPPHKINYRANIWALKELGVKKILAPSAVGSLREEFKPGSIVIPDQYIDFTKSREYTFYDGGIVCHISQADPFCPDLQKMVCKELVNLKFDYHNTGTYICIEGPRFSTIAESIYYMKILNADIIGMTLVPECILARELEMCYLSISTVTDYDVWSDVHVTSKNIIETLNKNVIKTKKLLLNVIPKLSEVQDKCNCGQALGNALI
jgi:5'-methylthioadenosine phosphorylase